MIDKSSSKPLYVQIQSDIEEKIFSGELKSGDRVMSENELASRYNVSRVTARQAMEQLVAENLLYRSAGKGTFVSEQGMPYGFSTMMSFSKSLSSRGFVVETKVLDQGVMPCRKEVAQRLRLGPGVDALIVRRLRIVDGVLAAVHTSYFSARLYSPLLDIDLTAESLLEAAERIGGTKMQYSEDCLRAVPASAIDADLLAVAPGSPMLELSGVVYDENNVPCRYTKGIHCGDLFRLNVRNSRENSVVLTMADKTRQISLRNAETSNRHVRSSTRDARIKKGGSV